MYSINGTPLTKNGLSKENQTWPSAHAVTYTPSVKKKTVGGIVTLEPPSGRFRVITWHYGARSAEAVNKLQALVGSNDVCYITTKGLGKTANGQDVVWANLKCAVTMPDFKTLDNAGLYESFSIIWEEIEPQT